MANLKSAIKRIRQNRRRNERNKSARSTVSTAIKAVRLAISKKDKNAAQLALKKAIPLIDKAAQTKLIHPNNASRKISRLTQQFNTLS
ncbi:MAG: 30S ribosomal protein S20 [Deltaproteobacteria bacterium GWA2_38_16]|nr:MAG: 30S ribosomal protein S20 [Deltaproteobacteria bacterium GWA2_38_16]OGQ02720.1 MAG: 30S ribosomal protein S20 [Deltaproteobacteria bacterium RIFCSPHIGHO2_02_FULL_38_15]OGQ33616.1 MAG: 30S ribosomal protein S20 [Deltaproteobacteria bacterium RIFCSPLOWO2_01_FULL_38_9]OGQ59096.1 MAG: 30S ribosomal protein S20 [Deltaproteobacteria bacterium RIFCSPLOWO2_12_FULL_38_8]HBQ20580.1 30S ribosomal protein S20 [Deltaproteobacteria bacterium]